MGKTLHLFASNPADIDQSAALLRRGGLVAFPTETVYGLGANALSAEAVEAIFRAKQRPAWDPLIVHLPSPAEIELVASLNGLRQRVASLAEAFWPGPLTLLLPRTAAVPDAVTAGRPLVGVRVPNHPAAQALLRAVSLPVAAPSANRFGHTSPTTAEHVLHDLDGRIDAVLDAGPCAVGVESTVLDPGQDPMLVYRAGAVTPEQILVATGLRTRMHQESADSGEVAAPQSLPSPGFGLRHYAPEVPVQLTPGIPREFWAAVNAALTKATRVGVLLPRDWPQEPVRPRIVVQPWGRWVEPASLAAQLFAGLRALEQTGVELILCPLPEPGGFRDALRDRLLKAAKPR